MRYRHHQATKPPALEMQAANPGVRVVTVPPVAAGERLDGFLQRYGGEPERSRSEWQRLIALNGVRLNGLPSKAGHRLTTGDKVQIVSAGRVLDMLSETQRP